MSDLVSVECPNCSARLKVKEAEGVAKKVHCPKCKESFVVKPREEEEPVEELEEDEPTPAPKKKRKRSRDDDDEPRAGRKKKSKEKAGLNQFVLLAIAAGGAFFVLGGIILLFVFLPRGKKVTAPESYEVYNSPEGEFSVRVPATWRLQAGGIKNSRTLNVKLGSASINISESIKGSLLGDIAGAGQADPNVSDDRMPVARVHDSEIKKLAAAEEVGGKYEEEPATTVMTKGFGKARRSAFTSTGTFSKTRGYRATVLGTMISYDVICQCSADDWAVLEPVFAKVIESLSYGTSQ